MRSGQLLVVLWAALAARGFDLRQQSSLQRQSQAESTPVVLPTVGSRTVTARHYAPTAPYTDPLSASMMKQVRPAAGISGKRRRMLQKPKPIISGQPARLVQLKRSQGLSSSSSSSHQKGLTPEEEVDFTLRIRTLRAAIRLRDQLVARANQHSTEVAVSPSENEWAMACGTTVMDLRRLMYEGQEARTALCAANVGLVTSIAKRYYHSVKQANQESGGVGSILTVQDMIQEGNLGLMEAAERFEPEKGFRFSTYAVWWIRQRILRSINDSSRIIRLPAHVHGMLQKIRRTKAEMKSGFGREPTVQELAERLNLTEQKLQMYTESSRNVVSLEKPLRTASTKEDLRTIGDTIKSDCPTPEEDAEAEHLRRDIRHVVDTELSSCEKDVIVLRFGLEDGKPRTVEESANKLGISRDRVRLIEARALNKLRQPRRNYRLKEYVAGGFKEPEYAVPAIPKVSEEGSESRERIWFF